MLVQLFINHKCFDYHAENTVQTEWIGTSIPHSVEPKQQQRTTIKILCDNSISVAFECPFVSLCFFINVIVICPSGLSGVKKKLLFVIMHLGTGSAHHGVHCALLSPEWTRFDVLFWFHSCLS